MDKEGPDCTRRRGTKSDENINSVQAVVPVRETSYDTSTITTVALNAVQLRQPTADAASEPSFAVQGSPLMKFEPVAVIVLPK